MSAHDQENEAFYANCVLHQRRRPKIPLCIPMVAACVARARRARAPSEVRCSTLCGRGEAQARAARREVRLLSARRFRGRNSEARGWHHEGGGEPHRKILPDCVELAALGRLGARRAPTAPAGGLGRCLRGPRGRCLSLGVALSASRRSESQRNGVDKPKVSCFSYRAKTKICEYRSRKASSTYLFLTLALRRLL